MLLTCRRALWRAAAAIAAAGFAATVSAVPAFAADAAEVVNATAAEVVELVKAKTGVERQAGFATILESRFDLPAMGQSALGTHWARSNEDQRTRFLKAAAFSEARAYSERFGQYGGQTVVVGRVLNRPNGIFIVESLLNQANGQPIKIDWEELESAFDNKREDLVYYVDLVTGQVILEGEGEEALEGDGGEDIKEAPSRRAVSTRLYVEPHDPDLEGDWMADFVDETSDLDVAVLARLRIAIDDPDQIGRAHI